MNELDKELMERVFNPEFLKKLEAEKGKGPTIESLRKLLSKKASKNFERFLFVVMLFLKLTGCLTWSWWIVTLPLWYRPLVMLFDFPRVVYNVVEVLLMPKDSAKKDLTKVLFRAFGVEPKNFDWDALVKEREKKEETPNTDVQSENNQDDNA